MKIDELKRLERLYAFPTKGASVIGYFVESGAVSGYFHTAIVEQSGAKQFRLRWADISTEVFRATKGKNSWYQYFNILGYIDLQDYHELCGSYLWSTQNLPPILEEPCIAAVNAYRRQRRRIVKIKKEYEKPRSELPDEVLEGMCLKFIHFRGLGDPMVIQEALAKVYDSCVYANRDYNYELTDDEDSYLYVPRHLLLTAR